MTKTVEVRVRAMDLPKVNAALEQAREEIERLKAERDEWEDRYDELLSRVGGTMP